MTKGDMLAASKQLTDAVSALSKGGFVVLHDGEGREDEADLLLLAEKATPEKVRTMRKDAGGLICVAVDGESGRRLGLQFATEMLAESKNQLISGMGAQRMAYGDMPAFSISINHLSTFTGITDNDRAKTISEFGRLVQNKGAASDFKKNFRAIGHVFLLIGRGIESRKGHTELSLALAEMAGATQSVALCEMLSDTGKAASKKEAQAYAKKHGMPFIEGKDIIENVRMNECGCGLC